MIAKTNKLCDLPLEMLDIILQKSYLRWILISPTKHRDEDVIRSLISVDVCFNRRITRRRFKKTIWRFLRDFYEKNKRSCAIIRNNRHYLEDNIQPNDKLIASLLSLNCMTEEESHIIQRQQSTRDKSDALLHVLGSCDEIKFSDFIKCLRETNQRTVARIIENGGVVIKMEVQSCAEECAKAMEANELLHQNIKDLRNRNKPRSHNTDKLISKMKSEGIEILNSHLHRHTVVVWLWCRSQTALEQIQRLYESIQLIDILFGNIPTASSKTINIDRNQFKKTIVEHPIFIDFTQRIEIPGIKALNGVTKLQNEIYVLCRLSSYTPNVGLILVFEDRNPFRLQKDIQLEEIRSPSDIGSSEKEHCLYICDRDEKCVWKITRDVGDQYKVIKWLTTDYAPVSLSVSNGGNLLMLRHSSPSLMMYGSDAELIRSIPLPRHINYTRHAVETSIGNFIIVHFKEEEDKEKKAVKEEEGEREDEEEKKDLMEEAKLQELLEVEKRQSNRRRIVRKWFVSELTRDGQKVIRRFIPVIETQTFHPCYLSIDSDDRVFVADYRNATVILLDSNFKWNRIICPTKEDRPTEVMKSQCPGRLYYDEEMKQLIVLLEFRNEFNVYTLSRN